MGSNETRINGETSNTLHHIYDWSDMLSTCSTEGNVHNVQMISKHTNKQIASIVLLFGKLLQILWLRFVIRTNPPVGL